MARGGLIKPVPSGVYEVNDKMIDDLKNAEKISLCSCRNHETNVCGGKANGNISHWISLKIVMHLHK